MSQQREIKIGSCRLANDRPLAVVAGPCIIESEKVTLRIAAELAAVRRRLNVPLIFKCSYDKANRSSVDSYRGPGLARGLKVLRRVKSEFGLPLLVDVHSVGEVPRVAEVADVLQVPAFLCRQTDLLLAAARTGLPVNVKKGQFLSPWDARLILKKAESIGHRDLFLTERGVSFGYNNLVVDMRSLEVLKSFGRPVIFDATHSVQLPGGRGDSSGGQREFIAPLARAAVAVGVAAVFFEVHPRPEHALSDGPNAVPLRELEPLLRRLLAIDRVVKRFVNN
ncbi:MAG TPA: 3-deoxy-8-phosphooctulonate synthase [Elusimicrobiota bacterium]|nr:3-deoxy-8-phosphooctulonate synthase [Elusimicrobiota bacterium]